MYINELNIRVVLDAAIAVATAVSEIHVFQTLHIHIHITIIYIHTLLQYAYVDISIRRIPRTVCVMC